MRTVRCVDCQGEIEVLHRGGSTAQRCTDCRTAREIQRGGNARTKPLTNEQLERIERQRARVEAGLREEACLSPAEIVRREREALARLEREAS